MRNDDGLSGGMESEGLLLIMQKLDKNHNGEIYSDTIITEMI